MKFNVGGQKTHKLVNVVYERPLILASENKLNCSFRKNFTPLWTAVSKARNFDPYRWEKGTFQPKLDFVDYISMYS